MLLVVRDISILSALCVSRLRIPNTIYCRTFDNGSEVLSSVDLNQ